MDTRTAPPAWKIAVALAAVYLVWGSTYLAIRIGLDGYPPFLMGGLRFLVAGLVLYGFLRWRGVAAPTSRQWRNALLMGVLLLLLGNGMVNVAEQTVSSGLAAVAVASMPLWAALFGALRGLRSSGREWLGLAIGFLGVVWLHAGSAISASPVGLVALLIAPIAWAFGSVWSRGRDLPSPFMSTAAQMLCGSAAMLALGLLLGELISTVPPLHATLAVVYLAALGSIVGFGAYIWLLHHVRPALATSYAYVNPPIAVLLGALLLDERFSVHAIGSMVVILCGVVLVTRVRR